jgi:hypothetical protein
VIGREGVNEMAIGDIFEVVMKGEMDGNVTNNIFHFKANSVGADNVAAIDAIKTCFASALGSALSNNWIPTTISAKRIYPTIGPEEFDDYGDVTPAGGDGLPSMNAAVISWVTAHGGKSGRGRTFIAGIPQVSQSGGELEAAFVSVLASFLVCLLTTYGHSGTDLSLGVLSRKNRLATPGTVANWFFPIMGGHVDADVATMRSRKNHRGV